MYSLRGHCTYSTFIKTKNMKSLQILHLIVCHFPETKLNSLTVNEIQPISLRATSKSGSVDAVHICLYYLLVRRSLFLSGFATLEEFYLPPPSRVNTSSPIYFTAGSVLKAVVHPGFLSSPFFYVLVLPRPPPTRILVNPFPLPATTSLSSPLTYFRFLPFLFLKELQVLHPLLFAPPLCSLLFPYPVLPVYLYLPVCPSPPPYTQLFTPLSRSASVLRFTRLRNSRRLRNGESPTPFLPWISGRFVSTPARGWYFLFGD